MCRTCRVSDAMCIISCLENKSRRGLAPRTCFPEIRSLLLLHCTQERPYPLLPPDMPVFPSHTSHEPCLQPPLKQHQQHHARHPPSHQKRPPPPEAGLSLHHKVHAWKCNIRRALHHLIARLHTSHWSYLTRNCKHAVFTTTLVCLCSTLPSKHRTAGLGRRFLVASTTKDARTDDVFFCLSLMGIHQWKT